MAPKILGGMEDQLRLSFARIASPHLDQGSLNEVLGNTMTAVLRLCLPVLVRRGRRRRRRLRGAEQAVAEHDPAQAGLQAGEPAAGLQALRLAAHRSSSWSRASSSSPTVGGIVFLTLYPHIPQLVQLGQVEPTEKMSIVGSLAVSLVWRVLGTLAGDRRRGRLLVAALPREGPEDEQGGGQAGAKQQDMPPEVKSKLRQKQRAAGPGADARPRSRTPTSSSRTRPTSRSPRATARADGAPRVVAKGADLIALRIREIAASTTSRSSRTRRSPATLYADRRGRPGDPVRLLRRRRRGARLRLAHLQAPPLSPGRSGVRHVA